MIHRAILGSVERMFAILTEHYGGKWPFWLSPRQIMICTISKNLSDYAKYVHQKLVYEGFKAELDIGAQTLDKKIRNAQLEQFNFILVIGKEELESNSINLRTREGDVLGKKTIEELINYLQNLEPEKSNKEKQIIESLKKGFVKEELNVENLESKNNKETINSENVKKESNQDNKQNDAVSNLQKLETKLKYELYLSGEDIGEEDKITFNQLKDVDIDKSRYPNLSKWKKLISKAL